MNQTLIQTIAGAVIVALGGGMLIWWLTGRLESGGVRKLLRIVVLPLLLIGVGVVGFLMARSQTQLLPESVPLQVVTEQMTVQNGTLTDTLNATGSLDTASEKTLTFSTYAPITAVYVAEGDTVHAGDVLATVDTTDLDARIRDAQLNLASAQTSLADLQAPASDLDVKSAELSVQAAQASLSAAAQTGSTGEDVQVAQLQVELAKNSLWQSQLNRDISASSQRANSANAYANSVTTAASLASAETNVELQQISADSVANDGADASQLGSASAQLTSAQASLDELLAGASDAQLRQAEIAVEVTQMNLDEAEKSKDDAQLVAPFDGVVSSLDLAVGETSTSGSITLIDTSRYTITLSVDEKDITQLEVGQPVNVTVEALDSAAITGTVTHVDPTPASTDNLVTYNVEVTLNPSSAVLRPGMTAVANVVLSQLDNVIVIPNRFISTDATTDQSSVTVETSAGVYTAVPVTLGAATDSETVIASGLEVGQTIVIVSSGTSSETVTAVSVCSGVSRVAVVPLVVRRMVEARHRAADLAAVVPPVDAASVGVAR